MLEGFCFAAQKKHKWKHGACDHVKKKAEKSSEAYKNKISYTPEDGHVGRNM
jgi:hypothetical protein